MEDKYAKLTQQAIAAWSAVELGASARQITFGRVAHRSVMARLLDVPKNARVRKRAEALRILAAAIGAAGHRVRPAEIARAIRIFHVAESFGPDQAKQLPVRTLVAAAPLLQRITTEHWRIRPKIAEPARALWQRIVAGEVTGDQVTTEVNSLLGRKLRTSKPKPTAIERAIQLVGQLEVEQQRRLYHVLRQKFDTPVQRPVQPTRVDASTVRIPDPVPVEDVPKRSSIFGGRRAG